MKTIDELTVEQVNVINEYAANICKSSRIADVFGVTEEKVKEAVDYTDFIRRVEALPEDVNGVGFGHEKDYDKLIIELAIRILA